MEMYPIRVLLIEDDEDDYLLTREYLSEIQQSQYQLDWLPDASAALETMLRGEYDVYLIDYRLGSIDGIDLLRQAVGRGCQAPIIVFTGKGRYEIDVEAMQAGAADYLVKERLTPDGLERSIRYSMAQKRAEALALRRLNFTRALNEIDRTILSTRDLRTALNIALRNTMNQLQLDAADVLLLIPETQLLEFAAGSGFQTSGMEEIHLHLNETVAGRAALERRVIAAAKPSEEEGFLRADFMKAEGFVEYYGVPLIVKGEIKGVLEVFNRSPLSPDQEWLDFLTTLAGQIAIAVENAELFQNLQYSNDQLVLAYDTTLEGWSQALDLRDHDTEGHTQRVTQLTMRLAKELGVPPVELAQIRRGALLHDIGKMGIPDAVLLKPGGLNDVEWQIMREHPNFAYQILSGIAYLRPALDIPYCHHEKWDGSGYPRGLKGEEIPLAARIFAVVDVWDALCTDRPYRKAWTPEQALAYIQSQSGKQFDPQVAQVFSEMMERDRRIAVEVYD